jgi:hypothetical protein
MKTSGIKSAFLIAAMGMISVSAMAQKNVQVPTAVNTAFANQYPQASLKTWNMSDGEYVAMFRYNKRDWKAFYSADGNWLSSERNIRHMATLPYSVRATLKQSKFAAYHVDHMARLQTPERNMYLLKVDNNGGQMTAYENAGSVDAETLYFSERGRLIKSEVTSNE